MATVDIVTAKQESLYARCVHYILKIPCLGLIMAVLSGVCFATASFTVEKMPGIEPTFIVVSRSLMQLVVYGLAAALDGNGLKVEPGEMKYLLLRSIFGFTAFTISYYALSYMSLADSSTIVFSAPVYVSVIACVVLKEPCGLFQVFTIIITIVGVVLVSRPTFLFGAPAILEAFTPEDNVIGAILSFVASLSMSTTFIWMRKLQKTSTSTVISFFSIFCITFGTIWILIFHFAFGKPVRFPMSFSEIVYCLLNGVCGVLGQFFLVWSLKLEEAGLVSLVRTFDIVMAFIYQIIFLYQPVVLTSILGALLVCGGVCICCLYKLYQSRPDMFEGCMNFVGVKSAHQKKVESENELRSRPIAAVTVLVFPTDGVKYTLDSTS